ncbi:DUF4129 domain-containing protein [uncultured Chloroflexus sp.]|uniref:DUF4129 domain-containing protein n=1 Tax=uncultured Chloroflexus sp. TaxID=214040 RepID=UPI00262C7274|nr:DUF4129 domain-containing protein [uncultured Chloroflexus sp.]
MRFRRLLIIFFAIWWGWPALVAAQPAEVSLADYDRLLRAAHAAAQRGDLLDVQVLAGELATIKQVRMPDGQLAHVDQSWLTTALASSAPDLPAIAARLGALIDALAPPGVVSPEVALRQWQAVYNEPPFNRAGEGWLTRFLNWLFDLLDQLTPNPPDVPAPDGPPANPVVFTPLVWTILGIAAALIVGLLFFWVRGVRRTLRAPVKTPVADGDDPVTYSEAQRLAAEARRVGDRRSAVRYLYLAALLWLDEQGLLGYERSLTNREHLHRLQNQPPVRDLLAPVVATFDAVWYGFQPIDDQAFARYEQQVAAVQSLTKQPAGTLS